MNIENYDINFDFMTMKCLSKEEWVKKCKQLLEHKIEMEERFKANADTDIYSVFGKA